MRTVSLCKAALLGATSFVAACGGGSKSVLSPGPNGLPYSVAGLTADVGTMTTTYSGLQFRGDVGTVAWVENNPGCATPPACLQSAGTGNRTATIRIIDNATIQVDGVTFNRQAGTPANVAGFAGDEWQNASGSVKGIFALAGDAGNPTALNSVFFGYLETNETSGGVTTYSDTFIISGFETNPSEVTATQPRATYTGPAALYLHQADAGVAARVALIENPLGTSLIADFGLGTLTGTVSGLVGGADNVMGTGQVILNVNTAITGDGFSDQSTGFTSGSGAITLTNTQSIDGSFYGQNASEIGGVITTGIAAGGPVTNATAASGFFLGKRP